MGTNDYQYEYDPIQPAYKRKAQHPLSRSLFRPIGCSKESVQVVLEKSHDMV